MSRRFPVLTAVAMISVTLVPPGGVMFFGWSLFTILFLYWTVNGIVGLFNVFEIAVAVKQTSPDGSPSLTDFGLVVLPL